jgi:hypothetical protein
VLFVSVDWLEEGERNQKEGKELKQIVYQGEQVKEGEQKFETGDL